MTGLFERALGDDWANLHPRLRERYGLTTADGQQTVGSGTMDRIESPTFATPVLRLLAVDDLLVPESGTQIPFTITTTPLVDANGYEGLFLHRQFEFDTPHRFVDTLRWNPARGCLTDLLGWHGQIAADVSLAVSDGALDLTVGKQWLRAGDRYIPLPRALSIDGTLRDWYDEERDRLEVTADVTSPLLGSVFGYRGQFTNRFRRLADAPAGTIYRSHRGTELPGGPD